MLTYADASAAAAAGSEHTSQDPSASGAQANTNGPKSLQAGVPGLN